MGWSLDDMPDLTGRPALVTGATSGVGEAVVAALISHGAEVVLAGRDPEKLAATVGRLRRHLPASVVRPLRHLADLESVRQAAAEASTYGPLHLLVNNAGVIATPYRRTVDGFELPMRPTSSATSR